ncbi:MAG TPA: hypothetical protein VKY65_05000 [Alphaproteobacteria bacterium]|nr:hypothetical protein [Alphaproteobacteria bacterium]
MANELIFKIDAWTPATFPMERLAEYMRELAVLLGETGSVHFVRLEGGSTSIVHAVDREAAPKVRQRLESAKSSQAPREALDAVKNLNKKLEADNASGVLAEREGAEIIEFPGARKAVQPVYGPFTQSGTIDGRALRVGGRGSLVPVMIQTRDGYETHCQASKDLAKEIGKYLFDFDLRFAGLGRWIRNVFGKWELIRFVISGFEPLDSRPLPEIVADLRSVENPGWRRLANVWDEVAELRGAREDD